MKYLQIIIITLSIIIIVAVLAVAGVVYYVSKNNPDGIKAYLMEYMLGDTNDQKSESSNTSTSTSLDTTTLSPEQREALEKTGIDPETLPATISPELRDCFEKILGEDKVESVEQGATLSPLDILRSAVCLKK